MIMICALLLYSHAYIYAYTYVYVQIYTCVHTNTHFDCFAFGYILSGIVRLLCHDVMGWEIFVPHQKENWWNKMISTCRQECEVPLCNRQTYMHASKHIRYVYLYLYRHWEDYHFFSFCFPSFFFFNFFITSIISRIVVYSYMSKKGSSWWHWLSLLFIDERREMSECICDKMLKIYSSFQKKL